MLQGSTPPPQRKSNIELLRILAMLMIIAHHIAVHSNFEFAIDSISFNRLYIQFIQLGGKIGVTVFVLISGYFSVTAESVKTEKVMKLWLQILTYAVGSFFLLYLIFPQKVTFAELFKAVAPILQSKWWFATTYFVLYLLSPFLNKLLRSLGKFAYRRFLLLLCILWCIIPTFLGFTSWQSNDLMWFVSLYSLAGYLRLHFDLSSVKCRCCFFAALLTILLTFLSAVVFDLLGLKYSFFGTHATYFYDMQKLPILLAGLFLFLAFLTAKIGYHSFINVVSSSCFGVYLLHDNSFSRRWLWSVLFRNAAHQNDSLLVLYTLMQVIVVFVSCSMIELFRKYVIEKAYTKPVNALSNWWNRSIERIRYNKLRKLKMAKK